MKTPTLVSNSMIWEELQSQKKILQRILERDLEHSIEEVSVHRASRILKVSTSTIISLAKKNIIPARKYKTKKSPKGYSYKFKVFDIHEYQRAQQKHHLLGTSDKFPYPVESAEELAKRVFG